MGEDFNFGSILDESEINDLFSDGETKTEPNQYGGEVESQEKKENDVCFPHL